MSKVTEEMEGLLEEQTVDELAEAPERQPLGEKPPAYMNRLFCSTFERVAYVAKSSCVNLNLGQYDTSSELYLYTIYGLKPKQYAKANIFLGIYDLINDPLTAVIIDNMRTRWGKFKPFQYLALIPSLIIGLATCLLPLIAQSGGFGDSERLWAFMAISYASETVAAFFGGGGYIDNVFTPNPNERTSLLTAAKFVSEFFAKFPSQMTGVLLTLIRKEVIHIDLVKTYVVLKTGWWIIATVPGILWIIASKERVPQSKKPPNPYHSISSVFKNKPLLIYTLSGVIGGIDIAGGGETLYYDQVLGFPMLSTVGGIPGMPISYISYPLATKLRKRFSTKALWLMQCGSITFSETLFFFVGLIGGKVNGLYKKTIPMIIAFAAGNCVEMLFYGTKRIINDEINYEVLDYCEWKNGYRVEATVNLLRGYFDKVKNIILKYVNAVLLVDWSGFQEGANVVQTDLTKWRMFITACGPKLIFGLLCMIPMLFYNIDKTTREQMYQDLEKSRAKKAEEERQLMQQETAEAETN